MSSDRHPNVASWPREEITAEVEGPLEQVASLDEVQVPAWALADILKVLSALTFQGR